MGLAVCRRGEIMMNKQELIDKLNKILTTPSETEGSDFDIAYNYAIKRAILLAEDLDDPVRPPELKPMEPEKPVVPQFVADWYEENKDDLEYNLYKLCIDFREQKLRADLHGWFNNDNHKCIETLVKMKLCGYEVEKEKLYMVELPNPNGDSNRYGLCKVDARIIIGSFVFGLNKASNAKLTESEIKEDFEWAWQFAKEVK